MAGAPAQAAATVGFTTPRPPLQPAVLVAPAIVRVLAQAVVFRIPALAPAANILPQGFVLVREEHQPTSLVACLNGHPNPLAHFLPQAWYHMERYGLMYPDLAQVHVIVVNLEKSTLVGFTA